jgi:hypothetical protein
MVGSHLGHPVRPDARGKCFNAWLTASSPEYDVTDCTRPRLSWITLVIAETVQENENYGGWWTSAAMQTLVTEAVMILLGSYYMGLTVHHASSHGYLLLHHLDGVPYRSDFRLMTIGALLYLIAAWISLAFILLILRALNRPEEFRLPGYIFIFTALAAALVPWMSSWPFFAGYVRLAGPL